MAFVHRHDLLFTEHWTPERAAAGYSFSGYEVRNGEVVLHGQPATADRLYENASPAGD